MNQPREGYSGIPDWARNPIKEIPPLVTDGREILAYGFELGRKFRNPIQSRENGLISFDFQAGNQRLSFANIQPEKINGIEDWLKGNIVIEKYGLKVGVLFGAVGGGLLAYKESPFGKRGVGSRREFIQSIWKILKYSAVGTVVGGLSGCSPNEAFAQVVETLGLEGTSLAATATAVATGQIQPTETPQILNTATGFVEVSKTPEGKITITSSPTPTITPTETSRPTLTITPTASETLMPTFTYTSPQKTKEFNSKLGWNPNIWFHRLIQPTGVGKIELASDQKYGDIIHYEIIMDLKKDEIFWTQLSLLGDPILPPWKVKIPIRKSSDYRGNLLTIFSDTSWHTYRDDTIAATIDINADVGRNKILLLNHQPQGIGSAVPHSSSFEFEPNAWNELEAQGDENGTIKVFINGSLVVEGQVNKITDGSLPDQGTAIRGLHAGAHGGGMPKGVWVDNGTIEISSFA